MTQRARDAGLGTLSKPRRQRQRERGKTKGIMSRTMALHVHYKTLYIYLSRPLQNNNVKSLHSAYLRQRESRRQIFHVSIVKWNLPSDNFDAVRQTKYIQPFAKFVREMQVLSV